jgi:hypothetical protein
MSLFFRSHPPLSLLCARRYFQIGKIKAGFLADFVVIDKDFTSLSDYHAIWNCTVLYTFVDGNMRFQHPRLHVEQEQRVDSL